MGRLYDDKSIESLSPLEFTRLRPGVYAGDCTYSTQLLIEIFSNAVDEFNSGNGSVIDVEIKKDVVKVKDYGQGFLVNSVREDGKTILEAAFSVLNTSGKYREDGTYEGTSLGSFGIGCKISTFLANWLIVKTCRDGKFEEIKFIEGVFDSRKVGDTSEPNGTTVQWKPSAEFFTNTEVEAGKVKDLLKTTASLCQGLTINLDLDGKKETYFSKNGLNDLVDEKFGGNEIISKRLKVAAQEGKFKLNLVMTFTDGYSSTIIPYVNTGLTDSGSHISQLKTTLTREFNKFFRDKKWLKEKETNLSGDSIQEGMVIIFNYIAPSVGYDAQIKSRITRIDTKFEVSSFTTALQNWLLENEKEVKTLFDKAILARKAAEAAKKAREAVRSKAEKKTKAVKFATKLADAYSKDRSRCELYVTEGDSASGNLKMARDNEFQAVIPVRGKILNIQSITAANISKAQKNQEIMTLIEAFGLEFDAGTLKVKYDKDKLRYGKIIIMSDADVSHWRMKDFSLYQGGQII